VTAATRWILVIVGLLAANMIAMIWLAVTASAGDHQVIPAYYEQAVRYDQTIDDAVRSRALGWAAAIELRGGSAEVSVRDAAGAPILDSRVRVEGYQRAYAADRIDVELAAVGGGGYRAPLPVARAGWHDVTIVVERNGLRYVQRLAVEAR
jgi:nitrogen fixation protein FixH